MLSTKIYDELTAYLFVVTDGTEENTFKYYWVKNPPEGQTLTEYLQNCKQEAEFLAQLEIDKKTTPKEIVL